MKIVVQRVAFARVTVEGKLVSEIGAGMMVLVGVADGDTEEDMRYLAAKSASLRIFNDENGVMNLSVKDIGGEIMAVSQFTLLASTRKGNRPSYIAAARPPLSVELYDAFCNELQHLTGKPVKKGIFGADMKVELLNDGPVTIVIDSQAR